MNAETPAPTAAAGPGGAAGPLALENRRRIYDFIARTPGAHLRAIQRALHMPYGTAEYHLHALEDAALVRAAQDGNLRRYFAADFAFADREHLGFLRKRPVRSIVVALLEGGEMTHQDLARAAGIKPPTLSYHLERLEGSGVVKVRREGRHAFVSVREPKLLMRLLIVHGSSFADTAVDRFIETWNAFGLETLAGTAADGGAPAESVPVSLEKAGPEPRPAHPRPEGDG